MQLVGKSSKERKIKALYNHKHEYMLFEIEIPHECQNCTVGLLGEKGKLGLTGHESLEKTLNDFPNSYTPIYEGDIMEIKF